MASETPDHHPSPAQPSIADQDEESLTPLEQEVLDEYARLLGNLNTVTAPPPFFVPSVFLHSDWDSLQMSTLLLSLSNAPSAAILDGLRGLERKTSLVFTLLKASVYSIVLNQQITDAAGEGQDEGERWRSEKEERERRGDMED